MHVDVLFILAAICFGAQQSETVVPDDEVRIGQVGNPLIPGAKSKIADVDFAHALYYEVSSSSEDATTAELILRRTMAVSALSTGVRDRHRPDC